MPGQSRHRTRRPNGARENPVRSVRVGDELWNKAVNRATYDGVTISQVLYAFVEGYARGLIDLPRIEVIYAPPKPPKSDEVA